MNIFQAIILICLLGNLALGGLVLGFNHKRTSNIGFGVLSMLIAIWLVSMFFGSLPLPEGLSLFWVRQTSAAAGMIPMGFFFIYLVTINPELTIRQATYRLRPLEIACLAIVLLCYSPFFALSVAPIKESEVVPSVKYGWGFIFFMIYFLWVIASMAVALGKGNKNTVGAQREELLFLQLGGCVSLVYGVGILGISEVLKNPQIGAFLPLSVLILDGFVAYGIATHRIMAASEVLQRVLAYLLMAIYLGGIYIASAWIGGLVFKWIVNDPDYLSCLFAALVVAFSVIPAQNWMQRFSSRLFTASNRFDADRVLKESERVFQEVSTERTLLASFSDFITREFRTTRVVLLQLKEDGSFSEYWSFPEERNRMERVALKLESSLVRLIRQDHESFTVYTLERMRATPLVMGALREIKATGAAVAIGCFLHRTLEVVVLLYPKKNGAIFDLREQQALQLVCNQLAVALENASLYTAVQNGKIYNELLLDSLTSGIIAVNETREVTVFNQRAQSITRLPAADVVNASVEKLPPALVEVVNKILSSNSGVRDEDMVIEAGSDRIPIRISGSAFRSHTGRQLGVLLVFSDMTLLRKMEEQIRRTDRLSSIGTLSAGMAHEIKNPLVTIKTFTELLPEHYENPEFRETFFDLVHQEVQRIDTIVNRLLDFARPAKASLKPVHLHSVIENSIRLIEQQALKNNIQLKINLAAERNLVLADADQINQILINLFLNAIQAMENGGTLSVETVQAGSSISINVRDTGCGIPENQIKYVFDPFFTTKDSGVGLGLSVSHGIIQEHHGTIHVESKQNVGTTFHMALPLAEEEDI